RTRGRPATVHAEGCPLATDHAVPVKTPAALNALGQPGTTACTGCDAAVTLLPVLAHGQEDVHPSGTWSKQQVRRAEIPCSRGPDCRGRPCASPGTAPRSRTRHRRPGG
ncbi:DUF6233 domain-containing protein, partial [Streptomyces katrae]|uniref:DUF6233 domain-containing protein n=1 Tax=Streptomyces katrae TaxID=68223 RepID=UPI003CCC3DD9